MNILINTKNEITAYATIGTFDNGIDCIIPDSVLNDNPLSYKYIDGEFVKNPDYKQPARHYLKTSFSKRRIKHYPTDWNSSKT